MKASEARAIAENGGEIDQEYLKQVYADIERTANRGNCQIAIEDSKKAKAIIRQLREDGYTIISDYDPKDCMTIHIISW